MKNKSKAPTRHTPGPWYPVGSFVEVERDDVADICTTNPDNFGQGHLGRSGEEMFANAVLLAAAPAMAKALADCLNAIDALATGGKVTNDIRRTIDRAEHALKAAGGEP